MFILVEDLLKGGLLVCSWTISGEVTSGVLGVDDSSVGLLGIHWLYRSYFNICRTSCSRI